MHTSNGLLIAALGVSAAFAGPALGDDDDDRERRRIVTVGFGAGLNTAQPGNSENHHVIPQTIRVRTGDVVNFVVSGLHIVRVYDEGVRLRDVKDQLPDECEVNPLPPEEFPESCLFDSPAPVPVIPQFDLAVYYEGINPLAPPPEPPPPPFAMPSAAVNRVEAVSFLAPGRYLVICPVLEHFNDGMYAWVEVRGRDSADDGADDYDDADDRPSSYPGGHH